MEIDFASVKTMVENFIPFVKKVGVTLEDAAPNRVRLALEPDPSNMNHLGSAHAGALFTFGETCGGAAIMVSFDLITVVLLAKGARIDYKRQVKGKITCAIEVPPEEVKKVMERLDAEGRAVFPLSMDFIDGEGKVAATMTVDYYFKRTT